jgi:hypothetical protein
MVKNDKNYEFHTADLKYEYDKLFSRILIEGINKSSTS